MLETPTVRPGPGRSPREHELVRREADLAGVAVANEFEARLQRALEMSATEERVHSVTRQALEEAVS